MSKLIDKIKFSNSAVLNLKLMLLFVFVLLLTVSASVRNGSRMLVSSEITFANENQPLLEKKIVNNLLIQNKGSVKNIAKDALVLNSIETQLDANPYVRNSEVYVSVNGEVGVDILQKRPLGRVETDKSFYIDEEGKKMPTSPNFSVRVPLVTGKEVNTSINELFSLLKSIDEDPFFRKEIVGIVVLRDKKFKLLLREFNFYIVFGSIENKMLKLNNFKAFYKKATKDKTINNYKYVNLQIASQVICTKK